MRRLKKLLALIYDLPNAYRVIEIMDKAGVDIYSRQPEGSDTIKWEVQTKWWLDEKDAKDLQTICLHGHQYKKRNMFLFHWFFGNEFHEHARVRPEWYNKPEDFEYDE